MTRPFSLETKFIIGACAVIDAAAIVVLADGTHTVRMCGYGWLLIGLEMVVVFSVGAVPVAIALAGVGIAAVIPELRSRTVWIASAVLLSILAVGSVAAAVQQFPIPSEPIVCTL